MRMSKGLYMRSLRNDADGSCLRRCVCPLARALLFIYAASVAPLRFARSLARWFFTFLALGKQVLVN